MKIVQIFNVSKGVLLAQQAELAVSLCQRLQGLLGRTGLSSDQALILKPCTSIHTFFMRFSIDVLFLDKNMRVIKIIQNIPPNRLSPIVWASSMAIELPAGRIGPTNTQPGDLIEMKD
jgi:uncharacterized membrane protein (UPF0127 family)